MNKAQQHRLRNQIQMVLAATTPDVFSKDYPQPLAIGVAREIKGLLPGLGEEEIQVFLRWWTKRFRYLHAVKVGAERFHVNGNPAGHVTNAEEDYAKEKIRERQNKLKAFKLNGVKR